MDQQQEVILKQQLMSLVQGKDFKQAEQVAQKILNHKPEDIEVWFVLAQLQQTLGNKQGALFAYMKSVARPSAHAVKALDQLTLLCIQNGLFDDGLKGAEYWIQLDPKNADAHYRKGYCLIRLKKSIIGLEALERAHGLSPNNKKIHNTLAEVIGVNGEGDRALEEYDKGELYKINFSSYTRYLEFHNYSENISEEEIYKRFREFGDKIEQENSMLTLKALPKTLSQKIKIAYVSPDLKSHSVAHFLKPLFESHNKDKFSIYVYSDTEVKDEENEFFRKYADFWCDSYKLSDKMLAHRIKKEGIDILIDLAGYSPLKPRMCVFAMRPAPIQVSYLGFPNTTGLTRMDYRIVDAITDPEDTADEYSSEQLIRLTPSFLCFSQNGKSPDINSLPALSNGYITFGSFNNGQKITDSLLLLWGKILTHLPNAKLIIKNAIFVDDYAKGVYLKRCKSVGIDTRRVTLMGFIDDKASHLEIYKQIDIHLDTFPYSGTTTTLEALWMGVPSVTLQGSQHRSRVTSSILSTLELTEFIAKTAETYCQIAVDMSKDINQLEQIRSQLRGKLKNSALMNKVEFTQQLEKFFEQAYKAYPEIINTI